MKTLIRNHRMMTAVIVVGLLFWIWSLSAAFRGSIAARYDLAHGYYEVQSFGLTAPWRPDYVRLLKERYGIESREVAGCVVSESLVSYVHAYNEVAKAAAERKFGHDVFTECSNDARKAWRAESLADSYH
ncbi:MAG: hypothetical protein QM796_00070 [Chthoniobacteraceae bacterium]